MNKDQIDYDKCLSCKWAFRETGYLFGEYRRCKNPVYKINAVGVELTYARSNVNYCGPKARYYEDITTDMNSTEYIEYLESQPLEIVEQYGLNEVAKNSLWIYINQFIKRILQISRWRYFNVNL